MSVKGFNVNGVTEQYDYNSLDNKPEIHNVPTGGTAGQVLAKTSGADYAVGWVNQTGGGGGGGTTNYTDLSNKPQINGNELTGNQTSADLGLAAASDLAAKITAPSSPATGAFLVWNGSAWTAQTLSTWQGGNY